MHVLKTMTLVLQYQSVEIFTLGCRPKCWCAFTNWGNVTLRDIFWIVYKEMAEIDDEVVRFVFKICTEVSGVSAGK